MWTEQTLTNLIPYAHLGLERQGRRHPLKIIQGVRYLDKELDRDFWVSLTDGLRAYYTLFWLAVYRQDWEALTLICPKDKRTSFQAAIRAARQARQKELTRLDEALDRLLIDYAKREQSRHGTATPRQIGWTREDVVAEFYDEAGEPRLGPPRKTSDPIMPEYDQTPSPVRKVSAEEYLKTRRNPAYGGVKPEFAKESEHFAKELPDSADKIYDGTPLDELIGQTT